MKQKLNAKDFILIGVLTALMWIICMVISTIMSVAGPVTNVFYPSVVAIPNGIVTLERFHLFVGLLCTPRFSKFLRNRSCIGKVSHTKSVKHMQRSVI